MAGSDEKSQGTALPIAFNGLKTTHSSRYRNDADKAGGNGALIA
jgi:hypothetical protein